MGGFNSPLQLWHRILGACERVRVEGVSWIVRQTQSGREYRLSPSQRSEFTPAEKPSLMPGAPVPPGLVVPGSASVAPSLTGKVESPPTVAAPIALTLLPREHPPPRVDQTDPHTLRGIMESLRNGLPPSKANTREYAVGIDTVTQHVAGFLSAVIQEGGDTLVFRGAYGQGKTLCLQVVEEMAIESNLLVVHTEIDANENRLDRPHRIYRNLLRSLRIPGDGPQGMDALVERAIGAVRHIGDAATDASQRAVKIRKWLDDALECQPLAWLLSDLDLLKKPELRDLLLGATVPVGKARNQHVCGGKPRDWPSFSAGTQGDFASYLLSGMGRLSQLLRFKGLIIVLDEMEKWEDLNWQEQSRAGNLLGGLIWGATAKAGQRTCSGLWDSGQKSCDHSPALVHSGRCMGYPFTTESRCHIGVAIAMTPRGDFGPEIDWQKYGPLQIVDLPEFNQESLSQYVVRISPLYARAYGLPSITPPHVAEDAARRWREHRDGSARSGVTATIGALDQWRFGQGARVG